MCLAPEVLEPQHALDDPVLRALPVCRVHEIVHLFQHSVWEREPEAPRVGLLQRDELMLPWSKFFAVEESKGEVGHRVEFVKRGGFR